MDGRSGSSRTRQRRRSPSTPSGRSTSKRSRGLAGPAESEGDRLRPDRDYLAVAQERKVAIGLPAPQKDHRVVGWVVGLLVGGGEATNVGATGYLDQPGPASTLALALQLVCSQQDRPEICAEEDRLAVRDGAHRRCADRRRGNLSCSRLR